MSAVDAVRDFMKDVHPEVGETVENFAIRLFTIQMDIYSAHAGRDLGGGDEDFLSLPEATRQSWMKTAKRKMKGGRRN